MFVARKHELKVLENCYRQESFQMAVVYGRRRVGKTALLEQFAQGKRALVFTAQQQGAGDNLRDFSRLLYEFFGLPETLPAFATWSDALAYLAERATREKLLVIFDEFPYAAHSAPSLPSALQIAIDRNLSRTNAMLVLCGSHQGFMESEVLGEKSPLYGRRTVQILLKPFDYADAALMLPGVSPEECVTYYASLGGTPYYLAAVRAGDSYIENMRRLFFDRTGLMFDEPAMLMRQELRDPALYRSVLRAIAEGATRSSRIADRAGIATSSVTAYLNTLTSLGIIERVVPFGESETSKRSRYHVLDPAFSFWFRFVAPVVPAIESGLGERVAHRLLESSRLNEYLGHAFERVCAQWMVLAAQSGMLPLEPTVIGSWWGTDPRTREQDDIDIVAADEIDRLMLLGECKWRTSFDETAALEKLRMRSALLPGYREYWHYLFTRAPVADATRMRVDADPHTQVLSVGDLFS